MSWNSLALNLDQNYIKVLVRRAQSYEATEKLESALEGQMRLSFSACMCVLICMLWTQ